MMLNKQLHGRCESLVTQFDSIDPDRKSKLSELASSIKSLFNDFTHASVLVLCTHNSRRSHMAQLWLQTATDYWGLENLTTFSGGTEATAVNPNALNALKKQGFGINQEAENANKWQVSWGSDAEISIFSKVYDDPVNPKQNHIALMVCNDADKNCPVPEKGIKFSLPYNDPKNSDNTPYTEQAYLNTADKIALEMLFVGRLLAE